MLPMYILLNNYHRMCTESLLQLLRFCSNNGNMVQLYLSAYLSLMDCKIYIMEVCVILLLIQQLMNLNSSNSQDLDLRQAVEDQLDLILKIEQERKVLKKQNKILQQKLKQLGSCMQKYQRQTKSTEMNTEVINETSCIKNKENEKNSATGDENSNRLNVVSHQAGIQINMETINNSTLMNCSKLTEARSLLKVLDQFQSRAQNIEHSELGKKNVRTSYRKQKSAEKQKQKQVKQSNQEQGNQHEKQLASEMMKLTKQLNSTKKQLKEMQHKYKLRQKEIKELKKCLQHKNQALEKSRKEFNELSILMNSDKFKSVRNLEQEVYSLKTKLIGQQDSIKIKSMLAQVTEQYEDYRRESENKIDILVSELASKQKQLEVFQNEQRKSANY